MPRPDPSSSPPRADTYARVVREFGQDVSTAELIALETTLRALGTDEARAAAGKAHLLPSELTYDERSAVLEALRALSATDGIDGRGPALATLEAKLEEEQSTTVRPTGRKKA